MKDVCDAIELNHHGPHLGGVAQQGDKTITIEAIKTRFQLNQE